MHPTLLPSTLTDYPSCCDVFINHRGPDIKDTLASHLYYRLLSHGLQPFLDREVLEKGDFLHPQIERAITTASFHITIFSPTYASSKWCLDELVSILKSGATIIPIFYNVDPSELRWNGRYAQAMSIHKQKHRYDDQRLENWREALKEVSSIVGFELKTYYGDEGKLLDSVVQCVLKKRRQATLNVAKTALYVARYPTGLQEKVEEFEKTVFLQKQKSREAQVVGIVGMGGAGKTTLARELFNLKNSCFDKSFFLFDVRETARQSSLTSLQGKLLQGLTHRNEQIDRVDEGIEKLRKYLSSGHALIVLDDVDHVRQLEAFLPITDVLQSDSLILVTSRYKDVLTGSGIPESSIYRLTALHDQHSQQLFCSYAFLQPHPLPGFEDLVNEFCKACHGLPLSLKVFGGLLSQKNDKSYWIGQLDKLRQIKLPNEIQDSLKISYDALDAEEKQIFLDIACYFIGEDRDMAIRVWDGSKWNGLVGFLNLEGRCLVEVENSKIKMHDHLRDLGRNIADQENSSVRLWQTTNDINDLWQQSHVITEVRGIKTVPGVIDYSKISESEEEMLWFKSWCDEVLGNCLRKLIDPTPYRFRSLQLVATEDGNLKSILRRVQSPNLIWLRWNCCPYSCLPPWIPMKNIRVLEVVGSKLKTLWREEFQLPLQLRELIIHAPLSKFPKSIGHLNHIEKIVVDYYRDSIHLQTLPEEFGRLRSLKYLQLRCLVLESLPDSFGYLTNLQHLDLSDCEKLTMSEETFGKISTLEYLSLSSCFSVKVLPAQVAHQPSLKLLNLKFTGLKELPEDFGNLSGLEILILGCRLLEMLPRSLGQLSSLEYLRFTSCDNLKSLPDWLGLLTQLRFLIIDYSGIESLPPEIVKLNNLVSLCVVGCPLREMPLTGRMYRLEHLQLCNAAISQISFGEGVCPNLTHLLICECDNLMDVGALPPTLITLTLYGCHQLRKLERLCNLTKLRELDIRQSRKLEELPSLEGLVTLEELWGDNCCKLKRVEGLGQLRELRILSMPSCDALEELACVENLRLLEEINVVDCPHLQWGEGVVEQLASRFNYPPRHWRSCYAKRRENYWRFVRRELPLFADIIIDVI